MHIDVSTLALQTVNVLVLVWLLARYLFRPVAEIVATRRAEAARILETAQAARAEADSDRQKAAEEAARTAAERQGLIRRAAEEAEAHKALLLDEARAEAERLRAEGRAELDEERRRENAAAADRASQLAVDISARLLTRLPKDALIAGFIDGLAAAVADLPADVRAQAATEGSVAVRVPRALQADERSALESALANAIGAKVAIADQIDPGVIAGLELDLPHASVANSLRADLRKVARELTGHDEIPHG